MAVSLNKRVYGHARKLIEDDRCVRDDRDQWSEHRPSTRQERDFLVARGFGEYGRWHLRIDDEEAKGRYKFPYGDFDKVHRCGVLSAEVRAAQYKHNDVEIAAAHLHGMLDATGPRGGGTRNA